MKANMSEPTCDPLHARTRRQLRVACSALKGSLVDLAALLKVVDSNNWSKKKKEKTESLESKCSFFTQDVRLQSFQIGAAVTFTWNEICTDMLRGKVREPKSQTSPKW